MSEDKKSKAPAETTEAAGEANVQEERARLVADVVKRLKGGKILVKNKDGKAVEVAVGAEHVLDVAVRGGKVVAVLCDGRKAEVGDA